MEEMMRILKTVQQKSINSAKKESGALRARKTKMASSEATSPPVPPLRRMFGLGGRRCRGRTPGSKACEQALE
jgi:hypothetical protein